MWKRVLTSDAGATRFHLPPRRLGALIALAGNDTMFGDMDLTCEKLQPNYRNHGFLYEVEVPLIVYNSNSPLPAADQVVANKDLTCALFR